MRPISSRRRRIPLSLRRFLFVGALCTGLGLVILAMRSIDPPLGLGFPDVSGLDDESFEVGEVRWNHSESLASEPMTAKSGVKRSRGTSGGCATVEEMGEVFADDVGAESLRVRRIIRNHFALHGASTVRELPPERFCRQGFVLAKASEAGFGNEMYKILTATALSVMLNRSLIVGQSRHMGSLSSLTFDAVAFVIALKFEIPEHNVCVLLFVSCESFSIMHQILNFLVVFRDKFPFGEYVAYTNHSFTLKEVKHLWRKNDCEGKYGKSLIIRTDDFGKPAETNVLCSNWRKWKQPIIWFQGTTDAVAIQFFLKNTHLEMRKTASNLLGQPESLNRPNLFGELMRAVISPSKDVEQSVNWALHNGSDPDIALHMRMLTNRSIRGMQAALRCIKRSLSSYQRSTARPRVVLVSDTPSLIKDISSYLQEFVEVIHFDYRSFKGSISKLASIRERLLDFRLKDWGPAPRWVAFVDFFLAARARHAVVSGAHRRVGTTYAQLVAALAAANQLDEDSGTLGFSFFSSFQSNLLSDGLANQAGWGHAWNRFAGSLSCRHQPHQCAHTPLFPPGWWDGSLQSPIPRDIRKMEAFGVQLTSSGEVNENHLRSFCSKRKSVVKTLPGAPLTCDSEFCCNPLAAVPQAIHPGQNLVSTGYSNYQCAGQIGD
ncbi:hypothetical protein Sjap_016571 [Stephania japonica]|uniref:Uncharacterized protein n=1 Tax=Stephania japonica TaxID=461633 RepID=A0AAP0NTK5_9MAGN